MKEKDFEVAEAIAKKLTEFGLGWANITYEASFRPVEKGIIRKKIEAKRYPENLTVRVLPNAINIEDYKQILNKLRTITHTWEKKPSYDGRNLYLESKVGNVNIHIGIFFPEDKIIPIMSEILKCEIERHEEHRPAYTSVSFACKTKQP
jgi:hypothetical protein